MKGRTMSMSYQLVAFLRTCIFCALAYGIVSPFLFLGFSWVMLLSRTMAFRYACCWSTSMLWLARWCVGVRHQIIGLEHLPKSGALLAVRHQSIWETLIFQCFLKAGVFAYIAKEELMRIPFYGWMLRLSEMIPLARTGGQAVVEGLIKNVAEAQTKGMRYFILFPEGTRRPYGFPLRILPGIVFLYQAFDMDVVPIVLDSGRLWSRDRFTMYPGVITLRMLPPIPPRLPRAVFYRRLKDALSTSPTDDDA
ncbi:MAG: 1-acyl-sn-glycerol-3-phosphate acyltransferase [Alphaproteobacteria bacterium GM7ARS4]|nr:1-acyl-sn-glycerol-3-phosphate acyltransferase [Alphaproteobacteria bacterium GM7ARS4]